MIFSIARQEMDAQNNGMRSLLIATRNKHKVEEIQAILGPDFQYLTLADFPAAPSPVEDAPTFTGNAVKKAATLARWAAAAGRELDFILADDSGLEVDALNGAPGVHSARFAALDSGAIGNSPDADNNTKLLRMLQGVPDGKRTARFRCVIALTPLPSAEAEPNSPVCAADEAELATRTFEGSCEGTILQAPRGPGGFGYDPLFVPGGFRESFAELGPEIKNRLSHRARALEKLKQALAA